jgi:hypothetical protein
MTAARPAPATRAVAEDAATSVPRMAQQPAVGLAGLTLVVPVALVLGVGLGSLERSLLVLGPLTTYALPVIAMIAFWWEDWPGTRMRTALSGLANTILAVIGGVVATFAGQAVVAHADVRGVFDPAAAAPDAPTFPSAMPLAAAIFVAFLQLTLVNEGRPLRRLERPVRAGALALAASWIAGIALYEALVPTRVLTGGGLGAVLVCIGALQVVFYVLLAGWPFRLLTTTAARLVVANAVVAAGGWVAYTALTRAGLLPETISAVAGAVVAAGLVVGMQFEGWLETLLPARSARAGAMLLLAAVAALLYGGLHALADTAAWTRAEPAEWTAYAGLNAIGAAVILHVAIGRRWPFATSPTAAKLL